MSFSIMTPQGEINVPVSSGGGANLDLLNRITQLEQTVSELSGKLDAALKLRADNETYGLVQLSDSESVTDGTGLALSAIQNNPTIDGTLANRIAGIRSSIAEKKYLKLWSGVAHSGEIVIYNTSLETVNWTRIIAFLHKDNFNTSALVEIPRCIVGEVANYVFSIFNGAQVKFTPMADISDDSYKTRLCAVFDDAEAYLSRVYAELA